MRMEYVARFLEEGDIILLEKGHRVYAKIPEHFVYENRKGSFDEMAHTDLAVEERSYRGLDTNFLKGKYIVTRAVSDGGGPGHGSHDVYPNGYHVWAEKIRFDDDDPVIKIDFYQSGCFTAMIEPGKIAVVGKAKRTWVVEDENVDETD